jgi:FkbM family methyltransferase
MKSNFNSYESLKREVAEPREIDTSRPVWIFGAGNFGRSLSQAMVARGIAVAGFVETMPNSANVLNLPVVDWTQLLKIDKNAQLALGILNRSTPYDNLVKIAQNAGFANLLMPWDTYDIFEKELGWRFWLSKRSFLVAGLDRISKVSARLADQESRDTLMRITAFRLGLDMDFAGYKSEENQYFNEFSLHSLRNKSITYVDCGAYNGDTYIDLLNQKSISCKQAFLMEPDPENFAQLVKNVAPIPESLPICLPLAAADKYQILSFNSGQGEGGAIGMNGDIHIAAASIDEIVGRLDIDFIKLDVEGAEAQVLNGARNAINRSRPVLALSLYHNPQDIWTLPELMFDLCEEYDFYIRQHYYNSFESVFYGVPKR